ncbi:MAG: hypothetical protein NVS1B6_19950 [Steroidobacteraceae bacterium]
MVVREARAADWPAIEDMRDRYFAGMGREAQIRTLTQSTWMVAEYRGVPRACLSYFDYATGERWGNDLDAAPGALGLRAMRTLANWFLNVSDAAGKEVFFYVDPRNAKHLRALERDGAYTPIGVLFYRGKRTQCLQPSAESRKE